MKAKVTKAFPGRPDDEQVSRLIKVDEEITGDLAEAAVANKWAEEIAEAKTASKAKKGN